MHKIATLFDRDWEGDRKVIPRFSRDAERVLAGLTRRLTPTEKLDGTNVRLTVRSGEVVRIEKRRNPDKAQKKRGISEPWYVDVGEGPEDTYVREAATTIGLHALDGGVDDGEWSGEAIGPKIQGNPLGLDQHRVVLFSAGQAPILNGCPSAFRVGPTLLFDTLREFILSTHSSLNQDVPIEGIVWHNEYGDDLKLKAKDFRS